MVARRGRKIDAPVTADTIAQAVRGGAAVAERPPPARHFNAAEYFEWCEANCYNLGKDNVWRPFRFDAWQRREWEHLLTLKDDGTLDALTWMLCWPRRHGKSQLGGFYDIMRCQTYNDQLIIICANSADQSEETVFKLIVDTLQNSPPLRRLVDGTGGAPKITIGAKEIFFAETGSWIRCIPHSEASAYGKKIHVAHNTELCKTRTDAVYQVLASSTGDTWCGIVICDSNVGDESNAVVSLLGLAGVHLRQGAIERAAPEDPTIRASFVGYESLDQAAADGPAWIARAWLASRRLQMSAGEFKRNHLNIPSTGAEVCFPPILVRRAFVEDMPAFIGMKEFATLRSRYQHHALHIGGGLDRALGLSVKSDRTIWTVAGGGCRPDLIGKDMDVFDDAGNTIGKVPADPWEYVVLRQYEVPYAMDKPLKDAILADRRVFGRFSKITLEAYQARDIYDWCVSQRYDAELVHLTWQAASNLVRMMLELLATDRLKCTAANVLLYQELLNYREDLSSATPSYGGPKRSVRVEIAGDLKDMVIKDDALESCMWAIWGLRAHKKPAPPRSLATKPAGF